MENKETENNNSNTIDNIILKPTENNDVISNLNQAVPESVTMETLLAYTAEAAKYRSDSRRSSYQNELARNLKNRRMTRLVMGIGIVLLVMSVILVGITLSLSEHIDKMVKETHQKTVKLEDSINGNSNKTTSTF